jgi:predicted SprT family Zn-dependent metalloprotease
MTLTVSAKAKPFRLSKALQEDMQSWSRLWGLPNLSHEVSVRFNRRLRTTVARLLRDADIIEVGPRFIAARSKRREILCHELAHAAATRVASRRLSPHGADWSAFVERAGFRPVSHLKIPTESSRPTKLARSRYEHRCPVCQFVRLARRPVSRWKCAECVRCGLSGKLIISLLTACRGAR